MGIIYLSGVGTDIEKQVSEVQYIGVATGMEIKNLNYNDYIDSGLSFSEVKKRVEEDYYRLNKNGEHIVAGFSLGGSIAIGLSSLIAPKACVALAPLIIPAKPSFESDEYRTAVMKFVNNSLALKRLYFGLRYGFEALHKAEDISSPTLIIQGEDDNRVNPSGAAIVYDKVAGNLGSSYIRIGGVGHNIFSNENYRNEVLPLVGDYCKKLK